MAPGSVVIRGQIHPFYAILLKMNKWIKSWPWWFEFAAIVVIAFGHFIVVSCALALSQPTKITDFTDHRLAIGAIAEAILGSVCWYILTTRGSLMPLWSKGDGKGVLRRAFVLWVSSIILYTLAYWIVSPFVNARVLYPHLSSHATIWGMLCLVIINPLYEEALVAAYVIRTLEPRVGRGDAIAVSTILRLSYHVYQGPIALLSIAPMGIIFGYAYCRWRTLAPLVVAHALEDILGLLSA